MLVIILCDTLRFEVTDLMQWRLVAAQFCGRMWCNWLLLDFLDSKHLAAYPPAAFIDPAGYMVSVLTYLIIKGTMRCWSGQHITIYLR